MKHNIVRSIKKEEYLSNKSTKTDYVCWFNVIYTHAAMAVTEKTLNLMGSILHDFRKVVIIRIDKDLRTLFNI